MLDYNLNFTDDGIIPMNFLADVFLPWDNSTPTTLFTLCFETKDTAGVTSLVEVGDFPTEVVVLNGDLEEIDLCDEEGTVTLTDNLTNSKDLLVLSTSQNVDCLLGQAGEINSYTFFGEPPYTYYWSGPNGYASTEMNLTNLESGNYSVTVTDANGNTGMEDVEISGSAVPTIGLPNFTRPECYNDSTGIIDITVNFGQEPYTYVWSNNTFDEDLTNVPPGTYTVTVVDNNGCPALGTWTLSNSSYGIEFLSTGSPSCHNSFDGWIDLTPNANAATPLTYDWSNSATTEDLVNLGPDYYSVIVTDANGCENFFQFDLTLPALPLLEKNVNCSTLGLDNGSTNIVLNPSSADYVFAWEDNAAIQNGIRNNLANGTYRFTITDNSTGCSEFMDSVTIAPTMLNYVDAYFSCELDSIQFTFEVASGINSVSWSLANDFDDPSSIDAIYFPPPFDFSQPYQDTIVSTLHLVHDSGCSSMTDFELRPREFCVWPGDSNDDRKVDALDLLNIGLANGSSGSPRWPLSTEWFAQAQNLFGNVIPGTSLDVSFADCDGNGTVEAADTSVVIQNFGLSHYSFSGDIADNRSMDLPLWIELPVNILPNELNSFDILLGSATETVDHAHGLAFQIAYDPELVNISLNKVTDEGWLSETGEVWTIDLDHGTSGLMDVVITRTDGMGISGFGKIAELAMWFNEYENNQVIDLEIRNAHLVDNMGTYLSVEGVTSNSVLIGTLNSTYGFTFENEFIFPNPVSHVISIQSERVLSEAIIYDAAGQVVQRFEKMENELDVRAIASGVYFLHLIGETGVGVYKLVKL